ncbi:hypothetical protein T484DRAFT_1766819 [Baffinella frigidus]|nr:hypothetical protein T484DRAFT_1766819 [Cryptophyta sp. CCMP2293]
MGATQELKRARPHAENNGNEPASVERSGMRGKIEEPRGALDASSGSVKSGGRARGRDGCWDAGSTRQRRRIRWWIVRALVPIACAILQTPAAAVQPPARAEQLAPQPHAGHTVESPLVGGGTAGELAGEDGLPAGEKNASVRHAGGRKLTDANSDADGWAKDGTIRDELALAEGGIGRYVGDYIGDGKTFGDQITGGTLEKSVGGDVYGWGQNAYGQIGDGFKEGWIIPNLSPVLRGKNITMVSAGAEHSIAISKEGAVFAWGRNHNGQLGLSDAAYADCVHPEVDP